MLYFQPRRFRSSQIPLCPPGHYLDSAAFLLQLQREGRTWADMARLTGLTVQQTMDRLRLCHLEMSLQSYLRRENVPERTALYLLDLPDAMTRRRIAVRIVQERLCIRDAGLLVGSAGRKCPPACQPPRPQVQKVITLMRDVRPYRNAIRDIAGQMNAAGLRATFTEQKREGRVELTVAYPARRRRVERYQTM